MRALFPLFLLVASPLAAQRPVAALVAEYDRLAARPLWAGFTPASTPLAIYDGRQTWLVRHPAPPPGFAPASALPGASVMPGQSADVRANTHAVIGGIPTATLIWPDHPVDLRRLAATMLHEAFHVYQARAHAGWFGNEAILFTYPVTDSAAQRLQRLETEAFRRALLPGGAPGCWASRAMTLRAERATRVGPDAMAYERGNDLNEGLATWIEMRASGASLDSVIPAGGFPSDGARRRAYAVGAAQAFLLDRLAPRWSDGLNADSTLTLDSLLAAATAPLSCRADFTPREIDSVATLAERETGSVLAARDAARRAFLAQEGWQLLIEVPAEQPLWPEQFDPWNVTPLPEGEVLHLRHLRLGGSHGRVDLLDRAGITTPAGAHPLFNGIRRLHVTGLPQAPEVAVHGDTLVVTGAGLEGRFTGLVADTTGQRLTLHLR